MTAARARSRSAAAVPQGLQGDHAGHVRRTSCSRTGIPQRVEYEIDGDELRAVRGGHRLRRPRSSGRSAANSRRTTAGFALTTMQRRVASSTRAIRRTLERRVDRIDKALEDPAAYLRNRKAFQASLTAGRRRPGRSRRGHPLGARGAGAGGVAAGHRRGAGSRARRVRPAARPCPGGRGQAKPSGS